VQDAVGDHVPGRQLAGRQRQHGGEQCVNS
jgi:hypothetical protein